MPSVSFGFLQEVLICALVTLSPTALFVTTDHLMQENTRHDVVEDSAEWTLERVSEEFGAAVASIVGEVTEDKRLSWAERKQHAADSVPGLSQEALLVKASDKLHNLQSLGRDLRDGDPEATWARFHGGREHTRKMSRDLVERLVVRLEPPLAQALQEALRVVLEY